MCFFYLLICFISFTLFYFVLLFFFLYFVSVVVVVVVSLSFMYTVDYLCYSQN